MHSAEQVLTASQMRSAEQALIDEGATVDELMLRAGRGAADWVWRVAMGRPVTILCGPGNNGGDGYVIAAELIARGAGVRVVAPLEPATDAARAARQRWGGTRVSDARGGVLVDCLFGSGLTRPLSAELAALLSTMACAHEFVVAIDVPSGVSTDTGEHLGASIACNLTLALGAWKPAHFLEPGAGTMGERRLVDIGIGAFADAAMVYPAPRLDAPNRAAHKYTRGLVGVIGGKMAGAALLSAQAAMRGGAGYVKLLADLPSAGPAALVHDQRPLSDALADPRFSALLVGPGLGRDEAARYRLAAVLERGVPTVIDADALHLLDDDLLEGIATARMLLTPHEGELNVLCNRFSISAHGKVDQARGLAQTTGAAVLAKGADTVLATGEGDLAYFEAGPSWLATAGTGDVLAGLCVSRMAAGSAPFDAAGEAVWLHNEAARIAGPAMIADDLLRFISASYARFL